MCVHIVSQNDPAVNSWSLYARCPLSTSVRAARRPEISHGAISFSREMGIVALNNGQALQQFRVKIIK